MRFSSGTFWMRLWICVATGMGIWGIVTFLWLLDSVRNLNAMSVVTAWIAVGAGFQATLSMRKADPKDKM